MKRFLYPLYLLAVLAIGIAIIAPTIKSAGGSKSMLTVTASIPALGFYSARVPAAAQSFMQDWLKRNGVTDTSTANLSVREGSYTEQTYRLGSVLYRNTDFYIDIKKPSVSYKVSAQIDLTSGANPLVYITCPAASEQRGKAENCKGMTQI